MYFLEVWLYMYVHVRWDTPGIKQVLIISFLSSFSKDLSLTFHIVWYILKDNLNLSHLRFRRNICSSETAPNNPQVAAMLVFHRREARWVVFESSPAPPPTPPRPAGAVLRVGLQYPELHPHCTVRTLNKALTCSVSVVGVVKTLAGIFLFKFPCFVFLELG